MSKTSFSLSLTWLKKWAKSFGSYLTRIQIKWIQTKLNKVKSTFEIELIRIISKLNYNMWGNSSCWIWGTKWQLVDNVYKCMKHASCWKHNICSISLCIGVITDVINSFYRWDDANYQTCKSNSARQLEYLLSLSKESGLNLNP